MIETQFARQTYDTERCWLPCCNGEVRLRIPQEEAILLHERTCNRCGRLWTFATDRKRRGEDVWEWGVSIKLGRPTLPAVEEVLSSPDEDGWHDALHTEEMRRLGELIRARQL
jgi:hypothetical protein